MNKKLPSHFIIKLAALVCLFGLWATQVSNGWAQEIDSIEFDELLQDDGPYTFSGDFSADQSTTPPSKRAGQINVRLEIADGWHGYSQKKLEGQSPTTIKITKSTDYKVVGPFVPNVAPVPGFDELLGGEKEEFTGTVIWSAPIEINAGVDVEKLGIEFCVDGQVCSDTCIQFDEELSTVVAKLSELTIPDNLIGQEEFRIDNGHATIKGRLLNPIVKAGQPATVEITATMEPGWHIYGFERSKRPETTSTPTLMFFQKTTGWNVSEPVASSEPQEHTVADELQLYHEDSVKWTITLTPEKEIEPGAFNISGKLLYQVCSDGCDSPTFVDFNIPIAVGTEATGEPVALRFVAGESVRKEEKIDEISTLSASFWSSQVGSVPVVKISNLISYLLMALAAGLILNAMPCVLPVIGLKIMSFVSQAGENRGKIFMLNLAFSAGLISVFLILATLSAFFGYGWGDLLTKNMWGSIVITAVVFAFGLSMLGVWEIPIPGMSGGNVVGKKAEEEGLSGAFFLGILTTILATPCTGPMLVPALAITAGQPPWVTYAIFGAIGLGMAIPYLLIGIFPKLISWLPKPGKWMGTFKEITGFILMATVVFLLSGFSEKPRSEYMVAILSLMLVIAFGCWWIGRIPFSAKLGEQLKGWGWGLGIIAFGAFAAFTFLVPSEHKLDWQEFSKQRLGELRDQNRLVFIDFTGPS